MMLTSERKTLLLDLLARDGRLVAADLALRLGLSEDTIRRDLRELAAAGKLVRVHGGALPASPATAPYAARTEIAEASKARVAGAAAAMVGQGQVVVIDGGTTSVQLVRHLPQGLEATVITHSPLIAVELLPHVGVEVILIGGRLDRHSVIATGAQAMEDIARLRAEVYFMGVTGVEPDAGLTTGHFEEAALKRALMRISAETVVLASQEKLGAASAYQIAPLSAASAVITDVDTATPALSRIREAGVVVHVV